MSSVFRSFWMAGFESACHVNRAGNRLDMICATEHDANADQDYHLLRSVDISTAREGLRWHLIDRGGRYDFSTARPLAEAAARHGVQVIWNLCHYGWPDNLSLYEPTFVTRFARYAAAVARFVADHSDDVPVYSPINEISYFCWAAGEVGYIYPHGHGRGSAVKLQLIRAAIAGMDAIRAVDPRARFLHADPLIHVVAPRDRPDLARAAADVRHSQYEAWDMLAGGLNPELGGHPRYLDFIGANFYHGNQWELSGDKFGWSDGPLSDRWRPLGEQLTELYDRYSRPIVIAETSHFGRGRAHWLREISAEVRFARERGVELEGVCLYPIIDRPDWDNPDHWHNSGLWDLVQKEPGGRLERVVCEEYAAEFARLRHEFADARDYASITSASAGAAGMIPASMA